MHNRGRNLPELLRSGLQAIQQRIGDMALYHAYNPLEFSAIGKEMQGDLAPYYKGRSYGFDVYEGEAQVGYADYEAGSYESIPVPARIVVGPGMGAFLPPVHVRPSGEHSYGSQLTNAFDALFFAALRAQTASMQFGWTSHESPSSTGRFIYEHVATAPQGNPDRPVTILFAHGDSKDGTDLKVMTHDDMVPVRTVLDQLAQLDRASGTQSSLVVVCSCNEGGLDVYSDRATPVLYRTGFGGTSLADHTGELKLSGDPMP